MDHGGGGGGGLMNKFFMRISLTLIIYKNRKAAYLSARAPVPTKIDSSCFCRALGSSFRSPGCKVWRLSRCSFSFVWSVLCFRPAFRSSLATLFVLFHIWHKKPGKLLQLCRERSLWSSRYCFRSRWWTSRSSLHCCCGRQWSFLWFLSADAGGQAGKSCSVENSFDELVVGYGCIYLCEKLFFLLHLLLLLLLLLTCQAPVCVRPKGAAFHFFCQREVVETSLRWRPT